MEETVKKRGRKKKEVAIQPENNESIENLDTPKEVSENVVTERKKRGRKKKWETATFKNNYVEKTEDNFFFKDHNDESASDLNFTHSLTFGNLFIKVQDKESYEPLDIKNFFKEDKKSCNIVVSSDEEDTCDEVKKDKPKHIKFYRNINCDETKIKHVQNNIRCYNCHHNFENLPFYLPIDYSPEYKRYKIFGNFCSPNCVKSYCINNSRFSDKSYLVGQFYRALFGQNFKIECAPSILTLKEYGGDKSIEEYRRLSYTNSRYTLNNINTKIINIS